MNVAVQVKYNRMPKLYSKIVLNVYMCPNWKLCTYDVCSKNCCHLTLDLFLMVHWVIYLIAHFNHMNSAN